MIPVEQRYMAVFDDQGDVQQRGDCMTACIAAVFELPIDEVPFFAESDSWWQDYQDFVRARGLVLGRAWFTVDDDDPTRLSGRPCEGIYWIATVLSPRGKTRCSVCKGEKTTTEQWDAALDDYVKFDEAQPCSYCEATGLVPSLHCVVMNGGELVWDPHPQRDMGHLGFVSGETFLAPDPARLVLRSESRAREPEAVTPLKERDQSVA